MKQLFTIGYAAFDYLPSFCKSLKYYNVEAIADVRSVPYSKTRPEFNKEILMNNLKENGIKYVFIGDYCGARIDDISCYVDGCVDYAKVKETEKFKIGIERILKGLLDYRIGLLCAEKDPIYCHRDILICRNLKNHDISINHILADGKLEDNSATEKRLLQILKLTDNDLFLSTDEQLELAYDQQGKKIAYKLKEEIIL
jgi:uncharacterized protein (DUF488 family)